LNPNYGVGSSVVKRLLRRRGTNEWMADSKFKVVTEVVKIDRRSVHEDSRLRSIIKNDLSCYLRDTFFKADHFPRVLSKAAH